jgi:hypothetical protein
VRWCGGATTSEEEKLQRRWKKRGGDTVRWNVGRDGGEKCSMLFSKTKTMTCGRIWCT